MIRSSQPEVVNPLEVTLVHGGAPESPTGDDNSRPVFLQHPNGLLVGATRVGAACYIGDYAAKHLGACGCTIHTPESAAAVTRG